MERKKNQRRSRSTRTTSAKVGKHGPVKTEVGSVPIDEKEEQARLEAASALSSLMFLPPRTQEMVVERSNSVENQVKMATPPVTYFPASTTGSGKSKQGAPPSGRSGVSKLDKQTDLSNREQSKDINDQCNQMILNKLRDQIHTLQKAPKNTNSANIPQLEVLALFEKQDTAEMQRQQSPQIKKAQTAHELPATLTTELLHASSGLEDSVARVLLKQSTTSGQKESISETHQVPVQMTPNGWAPRTVFKTGSNEGNKILTSALTQSALQTEPVIQKETVIKQDSKVLITNTSTTNRKQESCDTNLPLKKRRLVNVSDSNTKTETSVPEKTAVTLPSVTTVKNNADVSSETKRLQRLDPGYISTMLFPTTVCDKSLDANERQRVEAPVASIKEEYERRTYSPVSYDPRASLIVLSEVKIALTPDEDGDLPLHLAAVQENVEMSRKFVELMSVSGKSVDRYNKAQQTPLHLAVMVDHADIVTILMDAGANPNLVDQRGYTAVHLAVSLQHSSCLHVLLAKYRTKCDLNLRNYDGYCPLHTAVRHENLKMLQALVEAGADINIVDGKSGRSVIFHAVDFNQLEMVQYLQEHGANVEQPNYASVTPLMSAQAQNLQMIATFLIRASDSIKAFDERSSTPTKKMAIPRIPSKASLCVTESSGRSLLKPSLIDAGRQIALPTSSRSSPIDLSVSRSPAGNGAESKPVSNMQVKKDSRVRENHSQIVAALEGRMVSSKRTGGEVRTVIKNEPLEDIQSQEHHVLTLSQGDTGARREIPIHNYTQFAPIIADPGDVYSDSAMRQIQSQNDTQVQTSSTSGLSRTSASVLVWENSSVPENQNQITVTDIGHNFSSFLQKSGELNSVSNDTAYSEMESTEMESVISQSTAGSVVYETEPANQASRSVTVVEDSEEHELVIDETRFLDEGKSVQTQPGGNNFDNQTKETENTVISMVAEGEMEPRSPSPPILTPMEKKYSEVKETFTNQYGNNSDVRSEAQSQSAKEIAGNAKETSESASMSSVKDTTGSTSQDKQQFTFYFKHGESFVPIVLDGQFLQENGRKPELMLESALEVLRSMTGLSASQTVMNIQNGSVSANDQGLVHDQHQGPGRSNPVATETTQASTATETQECSTNILTFSDQRVISESPDSRLPLQTDGRNIDQSVGQLLQEKDSDSTTRDLSGISKIQTASSNAKDTVLSGLQPVSQTDVQHHSVHSSLHPQSTYSSVQVSTVVSSHQNDQVDISSNRTSGRRGQKRGLDVLDSESSANPSSVKRNKTLHSQTSKSDKTDSEKSRNVTLKKSAANLKSSEQTGHLGKKVGSGLAKSGTNNDIAVPNLTLMSYPQIPRQVPAGSQSTPAQRGTISSYHRGPVGSSEGTLTRVSANIKNKLSKALKSPQRNVSQSRPPLAFQEGDSRFPKIEVQSQTDKQ